MCFAVLLHRLEYTFPEEIYCIVQATADATYHNTGFLFDGVRLMKILPTHQILIRDLDSLDPRSPFSKVGYTMQHIPHQSPEGKDKYHSKVLIILTYPISLEIIQQTQIGFRWTNLFLANISCIHHDL